MKTKYLARAVLALLLGLSCSLFPAQKVSAAPTTSVTVTKYAPDGTTVIAAVTLTYQQMRDTLPVQGDGTTHYYMQGPVFLDDPANLTHQELLRWNPAEDTNVLDKDMGAVKGTNLVNLCNLVGGMAAGDTLKVRASDGWNKTFAYKNVYQYSPREGPMVLCWYKDGLYPDTGYTDGMRLIWFADTSTNPWGNHVFGNWDWHEAADSQYWYYYNAVYPTTTGLSGMIISNINIYSSAPVQPAWDLNGDHACNIADAIVIGLQWNKTGTPGWIKEDLNKDGMINLGDIVALGSHWLQTW